MSNWKMNTEKSLIPWPSFTDLSITVLLLLVLFIFAQWAVQEGDLVQKRVSELQDQIIRDFEKHFRCKARTSDKISYALDIDRDNEPDIFFKKEATLLRLRFSDLILFETGKYDLLPEGQVILDRSADVLKKHLKYIKEVNVQGHTNNVPIPMTNWRLSTLRALSVLDFWLKKRGRFNPERAVFSATGYGEFLPANLPEKEMWHRNIKRYNQTARQRRLNRRIEILLVYPDNLALLEK